jgi:hypothetical protein
MYSCECFYRVDCDQTDIQLQRKVFYQAASKFRPASMHREWEQVLLFYKPSAYFVNIIIRTTRGANACGAFKFCAAPSSRYQRRYLCPLIKPNLIAVEHHNLISPLHLHPHHQSYKLEKNIAARRPRATKQNKLPHILLITYTNASFFLRV